MSKHKKKIGNDTNEDKATRDIVTKIYLDEPFYVQQKYVDLQLTAPKVGSIIKISEEFNEPKICRRRYINDSVIPLLEACGITVDIKLEKRTGMKKRIPITGEVDGVKITVQLYYTDNWENPPQRLPENMVWFNSKDGDVAIRYGIVKRYLLEELGLHINTHKCIDRFTKIEYKCPE